MSEPLDEWSRHKFDMALEPNRENMGGFHKSVIGDGSHTIGEEHNFTFSEPVADDDEEGTESKIRAFLDEKVCSELPIPLAFF